MPICYTKLNPTPFHRISRHLLIIVLAVILVYFNSIGNGFVGDDHAFVKDNEAIRNLSNIPAFFYSTSMMASTSKEWGTHIYRPIRTASYAIDYSVFGLDPWGYHLTNLLLHISVCTTLFFIIQTLFGIQEISFIGSILFALHPVHVEAVSWISSRADLVGFLFFNISFLSYLKFRQTNSPAQLGISLFFSFLSYLGKETMVPLVPIIILYDIITDRKEGVWTSIRSNIRSWFLFSAVCLTYILCRKIITGRMDTGGHWWGSTPYSNLLMMMEATATYLRLLIFPVNLNLHYVFRPVREITNAGVIVSLFMVIASISGIIYLSRTDKRLFFNTTWFYIGLLPIANIIPISFSIMAERFIYMASAGPIIAFSVILYQSSRGPHKLIGTAFICLVCTLFSIQIIKRNQVFKDEFTFYSSAVRTSPYSAPSFKGLADQYTHQNDHTSAIKYYSRAIFIDHTYTEAYLGRALAFQKQGKLEQALEDIQVAVKRKPRDSSIIFHQGNIYRDMGRLEDALAMWQKTVELSPYAPAYNNIGVYYLLRKDFSRAISMFESSMKIDPEYTDPLYNIGICYESMGDMVKAREYYSSYNKTTGSISSSSNKN